MSRVWITRTAPSADESAALWRAAGFEPLVEPLLEIKPVPHEGISKETVVIFTSKNAVEFMSCQGQRAICVGDATAQKASAAGFTNVISVDGTSADVTHWVKANLPKAQPICHVSGWHVRGSISEDLRSAGYDAARVKVYRSYPRPIWPETDMSHVALYSPLAAKIFAELAQGKALSSLTAVCLSEAAAQELSGLALNSILIAARPREDELIMAVKNV